jgi:Pyruvate/oxaloacetate carboxyltransferase
MARKRIEFMDTSFRDGFQSVFGSRVATKDFLAPLEAAVDAGTTYFEAGGGARFQSLFFYCNESAFDMMDAFRKNGWARSKSTNTCTRNQRGGTLSAAAGHD